VRADARGFQTYPHDQRRSRYQGWGTFGGPVRDQDSSPENFSGHLDSRAKENLPRFQLRGLRTAARYTGLGGKQPPFDVTKTDGASQHRSYVPKSPLQHPDCGRFVSGFTRQTSPSTKTDERPYSRTPSGDIEGGSSQVLGNVSGGKHPSRICRGVDRHVGVLCPSKAPPLRVCSSLVHTAPDADAGCQRKVSSTLDLTKYFKIDQRCLGTPGPPPLAPRFSPNCKPHPSEDGGQNPYTSSTTHSATSGIRVSESSKCSRDPPNSCVSVLETVCPSGRSSEMPSLRLSRSDTPGTPTHRSALGSLGEAGSWVRPPEESSRFRARMCARLWRVSQTCHGLPKAAPENTGPALPVLDGTSHRLPKEVHRQKTHSTFSEERGTPRVGGNECANRADSTNGTTQGGARPPDVNPCIPITNPTGPTGAHTRRHRDALGGWLSRYLNSEMSSTASYPETITCNVPISGTVNVTSIFLNEWGENVAPPASRKKNFSTASERKRSLLVDDLESRQPGLLAPICHDTMNLTEIRKLGTKDMTLQHLLDMCENLESWLPHMWIHPNDIPSTLRRGTSRHMLRHLRRLIHYTVVRDINIKDVRCVTNFFTVDKKDKSLRLVVDGRKVNCLMEDPPKMELPSLHEVVDYIMGAKWALSVDGISYFYQIPIGEDVGSMFSAHLSENRGTFRTVCMTRLPMGWSWAPAIAQKISNVLLRTEDGRVLGKAWIDNFIFAGNTPEEVLRNFAEFKDRCRRANVQIDNPDAQPRRSLKVLGLLFDLQKTSYQLDPEWIEEKMSTSPSSMMSPRELYTMTGSAQWHDYAKKIPLCHRETCIEVIRRVAKLMYFIPAWDDPIAFSAPEVEALSDWIACVRKNEPRQWRRHEPPVLDLWSDASDDAWAALYLMDDMLRAADQGLFTGDARLWHIFLKEAFAADKVLIPTAGVPRRINLDNQPLVHCINRGASANRFVNSLIRTWDLENITAVWVPTSLQLADPFTRGAEVPPFIPKLSAPGGKKPPSIFISEKQRHEDIRITRNTLSSLVDSLQSQKKRS